MTSNPSQDGPLLADVAIALSEWIGGVLPGLDRAMAEIDAGSWNTATRGAVLQCVARVITEQFAEERDRTCSPDSLDEDAVEHLAHHIVYRARSITMTQRMEAIRL